MGDKNWKKEGGIMPYIKCQLTRRIFDAMIHRQKGLLRKTGHLNYFLFKLAKETCTNYESYRNFIGELEAAKLEIYRRQIAPYEDEKIKDNGDVE